MKFLLDMGISPGVGEFLKQEGHESAHLSDEGLGELEDSEILKKARLTQSVLLTHDLDFGDLLAASGEALPSVVIFRLRNMRPEHVALRMKDVLSQSREALRRGAIISLDLIRQPAEALAELAHSPICSDITNCRRHSAGISDSP